MKVRVEYESIPIRHLAVQCPKCMSWFNGWEVMRGADFRNLRYKHDINFQVFKCPKCEIEFGGIQHGEKVDIQEVFSAEECYKDCLRKKEVWE